MFKVKSDKIYLKILVSLVAFVSFLFVINQISANAQYKQFPQVDNPNWKSTLNSLKGKRYSNLKGEGLIDYETSNQETGTDAYAKDTLFFFAVEQPYKDIAKNNNDSTKKSLKEDQEFYSQIRGNYLSHIVNKGNSVTMKNVHEPFKKYISGNKNDYYRIKKPYIYVAKKPFYLFTSPRMTKGTMKYKYRAGRSFGGSKIVSDGHGHYSLALEDPVMPYEQMYMPLTKKDFIRYTSKGFTKPIQNLHHLSKRTKYYIAQNKKENADYHKYSEYK